MSVLINFTPFVIDKIQSDIDVEVTSDDSAGDESGDEVWDLDQVTDFQHTSIASEAATDHSQENDASRSLVRFLLIFTLLWSSFYGITYNAMECFIRFLHYFFVQLSKVYPALSSMVSMLPKSLYLVRKHFLLHTDNFKKYVVCQKCSSLYRFDDCYERRGGHFVLKTCSYIAFPKHPHKKRRKPCGHKLLQKVTLKGGTEKLYPFKVFCYKSIRERLSDILARPTIADKCEQWRGRVTPQDYLCDVFDGKVWKVYSKWVSM